MSMIYLPTADQMDDTVDSLSKIAKALGSKVDVSTWENIRKTVKLGLAPEVLPIGTQLVASHSKYGDIVFDVVAHDYLKSAKDETARTMTLLTHNAIDEASFDSREAFYYAETGLSAGTYNFTISTAYTSWGQGTYQFTLTKALPIGGQLCIETQDLTKVTVYSSNTTVTATESCSITLGNGGTSLGTFGVELNNIHRVRGGSNNYKESAIRQFLNSSAEAGAVWAPQTKFDRPPSWVSSKEGFVKGFSGDFLNSVGEVLVPCSANYHYEAPDSTIKVKDIYTVQDRFYLASRTEIFGESSSAVLEDATIFPYYEGATKSDFIKYKSGQAAIWWTRTPSRWEGGSARYINTFGEDSGGIAMSTYNMVVACTIV